MDRRDVALGEATRQAVEEQVDRPRRLRPRRRRPGGLGHLHHARPARRGDRRRSPPRAPRGSVSRASATSSGSSRLAASSSNGGASLPRRRANAIWARSRTSLRAVELVERAQVRGREQRGRLVGRARRRASPGRPPALAVPAGRGSAVSSVARSRNAAAAATPPRACARAAERSSSTATSSSGPIAAWARCQARRSGSAAGSVASASARCASRRSGAVAAR